MGDALMFIMKFPHIHRPKLDLHSVAVQTTLELAVGGVLIAMLIRWMES
jgi:hypothetical protein